MHKKTSSFLSASWERIFSLSKTQVIEELWPFLHHKITQTWFPASQTWFPASQLSVVKMEAPIGKQKNSVIWEFVGGPEKTKVKGLSDQDGFILPKEVVFPSCSNIYTFPPFSVLSDSLYFWGDFLCIVSGNRMASPEGDTKPVKPHGSSADSS